jgi:hypothetical protein
VIPRLPNAGELDEGAVTLLEKVPTRCVDPFRYSPEELHLYIAWTKHADLRVRAEHL